MVNFIDRAIGYLSPKAGLQRVVARRKFEVYARSYEGAAKGRGSSSWGAQATSADAEIALAGAALRNRSRELERNNKHVAKGATVHADNIVGEGIVPRAASNDPELNKLFNELFDEWVQQASPDGQLDHYGQQYQVCRGMVISGEMFARKRTRRLSDGLKVPLQIQIFEPEFVDENKTESSSRSTIINGIEFDKIGRRTGYWMHPRHPGDHGIWLGSNQSRRIIASDIAHLYEPQRTQARGVPWTAPIIVDVKELHDYAFAELVRKKTEACVVGVVMPGDGDDPNTDPSIGVNVVDQDGNTVQRMEPGMFVVARGGKEVKFNSPAVTLTQESHERTATRGIAAGIRCPYELLTNDYSQVNYSSLRAAMLGYKRFVKAVQRHYMLPMFCRKTVGWFIDHAQTAGLLPEGKIPIIWALPKFEHVSPLDDIRADLISVRAGVKSLQQVIAENGGNPEQTFSDLKKTNEILDEYGLVLDSDPRHMTLQGQAQAVMFGDARSTDD